MFVQLIDNLNTILVLLFNYPRIRIPSLTLFKKSKSIISPSDSFVQHSISPFVKLSREILPLESLELFSIQPVPLTVKTIQYIIEPFQITF